MYGICVRGPASGVTPVPGFSIASTLMRAPSGAAVRFCAMETRNVPKYSLNGMPVVHVPVMESTQRA